MQSDQDLKGHVNAIIEALDVNFEKLLLSRLLKGNMRSKMEKGQIFFLKK